jgi:DNA-binding protein H-NS
MHIMAERGSEKITEWLDIKLVTLSSEERLRLIEEIFDTLTAQELRVIRDVAEQKSQSKLETAKSALLEEMKGKFSELGLNLHDVLSPRRARKSKSVLRVKYRSPDGETWSGRGHTPLWLRQLELQGHKREEYVVSES